MTRGSDRWQRPEFVHGLMALGLAVGLWLFVLPVTGLDFSHFPGDLGDARLNLFFFEHIYQYLTGGVAQYWNAPYMYPEPNFLAYSDNLIGSSPFYLVFRVMGLGVYSSFLGWFICVHVLNYVTAFYAIRAIIGDPRSAVLGAFIFAFSVALQSQMVHAQTFPRFAIPLAVWMAYRFGESLQPKFFFATLFFVVYQIYCGVYLGFMLAIPLGIFIVAVWIRAILQKRPELKQWNWYVRLGVAGTVNMALVFVLMLPYLSRRISPSQGHFERISGGIPTLKSHLYSQKGTLFWDFLSEMGRELPNWWNHQIFAGGIALGAFVGMVVFLLYRLIRNRFSIREFKTLDLLMLGGVVTFLVFLRMGDFTLYKVLYLFPGFSSMRALARIVNIELMFFGLAVAFFSIEILRRSGRMVNLVFIVLFGVVVMDNYYKTDYIDRTRIDLAEERTLALDAVYASIPPNSVVSYEPARKDTDAYILQLDGMLMAQKYGLSTVNAYTATCPSDYNQYWRGMDSTARRFWLQMRGVDHDTLYVVKSDTWLKAESLEEYPKGSESVSKARRIEGMMNYMRNDEKWMKQIEKKARERGLPVDSMLYLDAKWLVENNR